MEHLGLGYLIDRPQERDAIHVPVYPAVANERLRPGDWVVFLDPSEGRRVQMANAPIDGVGIVDPFLMIESVSPDEEFWLYLRPGSITSVRHDWAHPGFPDSRPAQATGAKLEAAKIVQFWADRAGISYQEIMRAADDFLEYGEFLIEGGRFEFIRNEFIPDQFWPAYETLTSKRVPPDQRETFFSCAC